jgi:hypothetical protein
MKSTNSLSAKTNIHPSFIPSISSSLNQSNYSTNNLNKTQPNPFSIHLEKSRDNSGALTGNAATHHNYYGSFSDAHN